MTARVKLTAEAMEEELPEGNLELDLGNGLEEEHGARILRAVPRTKHGRYVFDLREITYLASLGLSQAQIATSLAVGQETIRDRLAKDAQFKEAYEIGRSLMRKRLTHSIFKNAVDKNNVIAQIYLTKVQLGWKDTQEAAPATDPAVLAAAIREQLVALETDVEDPRGQ